MWRVIALFLALKGTLIALSISVIGTLIGSIFGIITGKMGKRFFSAVLGATAGLMMAIVCFELLPKSFEKGSVEIAVIGIIIGVSVIIFLDSTIATFRQKRKTVIQSKYVRTAFLLALGIGLHKLPEGLAVGSSYVSSNNLGLSLACVIGLHDIPEGFALSVPMKLGKVPNKKIIRYVLFTQIPMGVGALIGGILGEISSLTVALSLAFAGGAMLYITCSEIIPESNELYKGRTPAIADMIGFVLGIIISMYI